MTSTDDWPDAAVYVLADAVRVYFGREDGGFNEPIALSIQLSLDYPRAKKNNARAVPKPVPPHP